MAKSVKSAGAAVSATSTRATRPQDNVATLPGGFRPSPSAVSLPKRRPRPRSTHLILTVAAIVPAALRACLNLAFKTCADERLALLIRAEKLTDLEPLATLLRPAMNRAQGLRPPGVSLVVNQKLKNAANELSFELALNGVVLGAFTDPARAQAHASLQRGLFLASTSTTPSRTHRAKLKALVYEYCAAGRPQ